MELVNLTDSMKKLVSAYSGGMKRRLSLAIALLHRPRVLILDEPTVGIDPALRASIWNELRAMGRAGTTILVTTHVMVLIGFFAFFFVFLVAGISFLKERTTGTLERLVATPIKRWEIVIGYVIGFGLFTTIQAILITWFSVDILGMMMNGMLINLLLVTLLLSITALTLGIFLSSFANSEFQMMQFIPLVIVPQVFFSGLFNIDTMAQWLRWLSKIMPLYYGADAMRNVMIRGKSFGDIAVDLAVLLGFSIVFMVLNVLTLRKYRKV